MASDVALSDPGATDAFAVRSPRPSVAVHRTSSRRIATWMLTVLLAGCATPGLDQLGSNGRSAEAGAEPPSVASPFAANAESGVYRVQAGDLLALRFFFNPEFDQSVRVQPDGAITIPFLGTRAVNGMSIPEVTEMVRAVYEQELRKPQVVVQLVEAVERHVYVAGAVKDPTEVRFRPGLTPLEAVLSAGGFSSAAKRDEVILVRKDRNGRPVPVVLDLAGVIRRTGTAVALQPWDVVFVQSGRSWTTNEGVDRYLGRLLRSRRVSDVE